MINVLNTPHMLGQGFPDFAFNQTVGRNF